MKKLVRSLTPPSEIYTTGDADDDETEDDAPEKKSKNGFTPTDLVDILQQLDELRDYSLAINIEDGVLILSVGDSRYEVQNSRKGRYPRRRLRKLET